MTLRRNIMKWKLRFFGHIMRWDGLERTIITGKVNGRRKRGRPTTSWLKDIAATGLSLFSAIHWVEDRRRCWADFCFTDQMFNARDYQKLCGNLQVHKKALNSVKKNPIKTGNSQKKSECRTGNQVPSRSL
ncbi:Hypothetical predicted protein [Octopus vulgaris]|uniref:Uncharacterized protein n=1 Tax=Octopus vulgaris TaxID=6645 RepID=A0AA36F2C2_OCTVU|nr:Hypothetical predicted protein [Octopus vulgaris]